MKVTTDRLSIRSLTSDHAPFMFQLMNSEKWKEFIGDRNIQTLSDASKYIQKINNRSNTDYWIIERNEEREPIGIVTFMKRDNLDHFDIGFALLPQFYGQGFAFEATSAVLTELEKDQTHSKILAITITSNMRSTQLLERLGFTFENDFKQSGEVLSLYSKNISGRNC